MRQLNRRAAACQLLAITVALTLVACGPPALVTLTGPTMGTAFTVKYHTKGDISADRVHTAIRSVLTDVNARFSTYDDDSLISRFNAHRTTDPFPVDAAFVEVLRRALRLADATDGAYDPTINPLVRLYGFGPDSEQSEPSPDAVAATLARVGYDRLELLPDDRLRKTTPDLELDLSSIAKGRGVDRVAETLAQLGITSHMVEIGGEVRCAGAKPGGVPWQIGIERPADDGARAVQTAIPLREAALATSGDYRNFYESDGRRIHHVLDGRSGRSTTNGVVSVSVIAPDCTWADGLATALMIVGPDGAEPLLDLVPGSRALFLLRAGEQLTAVPRRWE